MKNRILIIYPFKSQDLMVSHLVKNLRRNGIDVDAINSFSLSFATKNHHKVSFLLKFIQFLFDLPIPKIEKILTRLFKTENILLKIANNYEIVDFHFLHKSYDNLFNNLIGEKTLKVTFWGSDFYRANSLRREEVRHLLDQASIIEITTDSMKNDIVRYYEDFQKKIRVANFGIYQFDIISKIKRDTYSPNFKKDHPNKLMVVCGYNGSKGQQHLTIINSLYKLSPDLKSKIFLVFPMTYGSDVSYERDIEKEIIKLNMPYLILNKHLSDIDIAKLRLETDIAINIQTTDAFSGSLQEHLYAENILIAGDWLPYQILKDNYVFYKPTRIESLDKEIADCIVNFETNKSKTIGNKERMSQISSWDTAASRISDIYKEIIDL